MQLRPLLLAVLAAVVLVPAAQARAQDTLVIKVTSVSIKLVDNDRPPKGASKGDTVIFKDRLLNAVAQFGKKAGAAVGSDTGTMTFTSASAATFKGRAVLPDGTLTLNGQVLGVAGGGLTIPVTGGTGRYKGVTGLLVVGKGAKRAPNTYHLKLPAAGPVA